MILQFVFIVSLVATLGSLYLSEVLGFTPCELCWYQRVFMYPIPILIVVGVLKKDMHIKIYIRVLSIIGAVIATYHVILQISNSSSSMCDILNSCNQTHIQLFGFLTIPMMSLIAFVLIFICSLKIKDSNTRT